jgi:hypothetical protein
VSEQPQPQANDEPKKGRTFADFCQCAAADLGKPVDDPTVRQLAILEAQLHALTKSIFSNEIVSSSELIQLQDRIASIREAHRPAEKTPVLRVVYCDDYAAQRIRNNGLAVEYSDDEEGRARRAADREEADREIEEEVEKRLKVRIDEMLRSGAVVRQQPLALPAPQDALCARAHQRGSQARCAALQQ